MGREYFCAFHSYRDKTAALTDEQFGRVIRAALLYSETGKEPVLDPIEGIAFSFIRFDIDTQAKNYADKCEKLRRNALSKSEQMPANADNRGETNTEAEAESETESEEREGTSPPAPSPAKKKQPKRFTPPTVEEVRAYCRERGFTVDAEQFVSYYESNGWKVGKNPMRSWKSAVVTWEKRDRADGKQTVPAYHDENEVILPF